MEPITLKGRIRKYLVHLALSIGAPFVASMILISFTGDRESGMVYGIVGSLLVINIGFAYAFIKGRAFIALLSGVLITIASTTSALAVQASDIHPRFDFYGFWTAFFCYSLVSVIGWEITYRFLTRK